MYEYLLNQTNYTGIFYYSDNIFDLMQFRISLILFWLGLCMLGIIGNSLVIFIAVSSKKLKDQTSCYIFNLAVTDLIFAVFCIPFTTFIYVSDYWPFGKNMCKLFHFISHVRYNPFYKLPVNYLITPNSQWPDNGTQKIVFVFFEWAQT